jgi:hypothetical protein
MKFIMLLLGSVKIIYTFVSSMKIVKNIHVIIRNLNQMILGNTSWNTFMPVYVSMHKNDKAHFRKK